MGAVGQIKEFGALKLAASYMDQEELKEAAAAAVVSIARDRRMYRHRKNDEIKTALKVVLESAKSKRTLDDARRVLGEHDYHTQLQATAKKLRDAGRADLAAECEETIELADAFILAYDNCPHIEPEFIYGSRRLLAEQIEKIQALK